jgi:hypothetical protein
MDKKSFIGGWVCSLIVFLLIVVCIRNSQSCLESKLDSISTQISESKDGVQTVDSLQIIPKIFESESINIGLAKMPKEFPSITNPTSDSEISLTVSEFADHFKRVFKNSDMDQLVITAVKTEDDKVLRWHIRTHEK